MNGVETKDLPTGARYLKLHHFADPEKGQAWLEAEQKKMADDPRTFRREILMDEDVYDGEPVFGLFDKETHLPGLFKTNHVPIWEDSVLFGGWDCGNTHSPAFTLAQVLGQQAFFCTEVVPSVAMGMSQFAPLVLQHLKKLTPGRWSDVQHFGDETGATKLGNDMRSAFDVAYESGIRIRPVSNKWSERESAVNWLLSDWIAQEGPRSEWIPRVIYSEKGCPTLTDGMKGAYCLGRDKNDDVVRPVKNSFSHVNDAHQYISIRMRTFIRGKEAKVKDMRGIQ